MGRPMEAKALFEAGFLGVAKAVLDEYTPAQRVDKRSHVPASMCCALKEVVDGAQNAGVAMLEPMIASGLADSLVQNLASFETLGSSEDAHLASIWYESHFRHGAIFDCSQLLRTGTARSGAFRSSTYKTLSHSPCSVSCGPPRPRCASRWTTRSAALPTSA